MVYAFDRVVIDVCESREHHTIQCSHLAADTQSDYPCERFVPQWVLARLQLAYQIVGMIVWRLPVAFLAETNSG